MAGALSFSPILKSALTLPPVPLDQRPVSNRTSSASAQPRRPAGESGIYGLSMCRAFRSTAWLATMAPAGHAKSRPGITPCGLIRDCWFPSSIALVIISGEERKGSGPLRKDSASRSAPAHGAAAARRPVVYHRHRPPIRGKDCAWPSLILKKH
jgi:hypothetical protein